MRRPFLYIAIPIVVVLALLAGRKVVHAPTPPPDGQALYARMCALCHGDQGQGYTAPGSVALANPTFLAIADDTYLFENTARGRPGTRMSAWAESHGGPLSDEQVRAIVGYMRQWQTETSVDVSDASVDGDPGRGAEVYAMNCAVCHGEAGEGLDESPAAPDGAPSLNNPVFLSTASDGFIQYSIAEGREETPMPAYTGALTEQEIDDLVVLIRSWQE
ncbi:MAG: c-type cytochrome [Anaerolineae bacterium]